MAEKKWIAPAPHTWRHIQSWSNNEPGAVVLEYLMWSDAASYVTNMPWRDARFLNTHTRESETAPDMALAVRWRYHHVDADDDLRGTRVGLGTDGELAALLSLATGSRVRSGGVIRRFNPDGDPLGIPNMSISRPVWMKADRFGSLIPAGPPMDEGGIRILFDIYADADEKTAGLLATVAREYASALWIAEADADLAWLLLVSALETVAEPFRQTVKPNPVDVLEETMPEVYRLCQTEGQEHLEGVATRLSRLAGSTQRFLDFMKRFDPGPPRERPDTYGRVDWANLQAIMKRIYSLRSKRLHQGTPFPAPMRAAPISHGSAVGQAEIPGDGPAPWYLKDPNRPLDPTLIERPTDVSLTQEYHGQWSADDAPMLLHTFADITRRTLLKWAEETVNGPRG